MPIARYGRRFGSVAASCVEPTAGESTTESSGNVAARSQKRGVMRVVIGAATGETTVDTIGGEKEKTAGFFPPSRDW
jgi:hypothetical protein